MTEISKFNLKELTAVHVLLVYVFGYVDFIILNKFSMVTFFGSLNSLIGQKSTLVQSSATPL